MNSLTTNRKARLSRGYSFAEVLVASALLGLAIGGAVSLSATMNVQHASAFSGAVAQNYHDNAARLWQLGLSPSEVRAALPNVTDNADLQNAIVPTGTSGTLQVSFSTTGSTTLANNMGTLENAACTMTIRNPVGEADRTATLYIYRPTIR